MDTNSSGLEALDTASIKIDGDEIRGSVIIIPLDAPLPNEMSSFKLSEGSLYDRIGPLADDSEFQDFKLVPLGGNEMMALDRAWSMLVNAKRVFVLNELPGARYDIVFTQARRQLGLRVLDWATVSTAMGEQARLAQRTRDKQPWADEKIAHSELSSEPSNKSRSGKSYGGTDIGDSDKMIAPPADAEAPDEDPS